MEQELFRGLQDEQAYKQLVEMAFDTSWAGTLIADRHGKYLFANKQYEEVVGLSDRVIRTLDSQIMGQNLVREKISTVDLVLEQKREVLLIQLQSYSDRVFLVRGVPCFDTAGEVVYVICHLLDLSALHRYEQRMLQTRQEKKTLYEDYVRVTDQMGTRDEKLVYRSRAMRQVIEQINRVARSDVTVFFRGESGVGKELFAKRLHDESPRRDGPFIKINCSAIPEALLESELFGYEAGTFTGGSSKGKKGLMEYAQGGTMFLDEVGTMPLSLQSKLLRVLQEREYTRLGGYQPVKIDIRFVAATNADLEDMVQKGTFRADLYYRLHIIPIYIPALRERKDDISMLVEYFIERFNQKYSLNKSFSTGGMERITSLPFPGNVRQLRNFIERLVLLSEEDLLTETVVDAFYDCGARQAAYETPVEFGNRSLEEMLASYEKYILTEYKKKFKTSYQIAEQLKMNQSSISRKLKKYGIG